VLSDILQAVDRGDLAAVALLDLLIGFDTVHLLERLQQTFGISDTALCWFYSHLLSRTQYVRHGPTTCQKSSVSWSAACHKDLSWARSFSSCTPSIS